MDNRIIEEIVEAAHHIYDRGMNLAKAGNISILDDDRKYMYITASGTDFKRLVHHDVIKVDINDLSYVSNSDKVPSIETNLHVGVYRKRSDVNSVVHVHSPYATAFAFSEKKLRQLEGFGEITGEYIAMVDYFPPGSNKLAEHASDALKNEDKILLKDHGLITVGEDIGEATLLCEYVEGIAKTQYVSHVLNL